jgi:membrane associated rhomboid family serine protease
MYFLLAFGHAVENFLRPLRYLALIALAALIGDLAHIALDARSYTPCIVVSVPNRRTLEQRAGMSSVASAAHLGGAAVGVLAWIVWRKPKDEP